MFGFGFPQECHMGRNIQASIMPVIIDTKKNEYLFWTRVIENNTIKYLPSISNMPYYMVRDSSAEPDALLTSRVKYKKTMQFYRQRFCRKVAESSIIGFVSCLG